MPKIDQAIRDAGFQIHSRPRSGEAFWSYRGRLPPLRESDVLRMLQKPDVVKKYKRVADARLKAVLA